MILQGRKVILASASPRRLDILRQIGIDPLVVPTEVEERKELTPGMGADALVTENAVRKAKAAAALAEDAVVIGSDTVVALEGHIFGKPADITEAKGMLTLLSGRTHQVYTGICLIDTASERSISGADVCQVTFAQLSEKDIEEYVALESPLDKAGAYAIQGRGALLVDKIDGDYYTVVGLPVSLLRRLASVLCRLG